MANLTQRGAIVPTDLDKEQRDQKSLEVYTIEDALKVIGQGKVQLMVFVSMSMCMGGTIMEMMGVAYMVPAATCELELDTTRIGLFTGIIFLGIMCTQHLWGFLADLLGRRTVILCSLSASISFTLPIAFVQNFWVIIGLRFWAGVSVAGATSTMYAYLGEFFTEKSRSSIIIFAAIFIGLANVFMPAVAWFLIRQDFSFQITESFVMMPWRFQIIAQLVPLVISLSFLVCLPESPKFLVAAHKEKQALQAIQWMFNKNTGKPASECPVKNLQLPEISEEEKLHDKKTVKGFCYSIAHETITLLKAPYRTHLLKCCYIQFSVFVVGTGFSLWFPELSNRVLNLHETDMNICDIVDKKIAADQNATQIFGDQCVVVVKDQMYITNVILGACYVIAYICIGFIIKKIPKSLVLATFLFVSGCSGIIIYYVVEDYLMLAFFVVFLLTPSLSISMVVASVVDLFPTHLRGMAMSIVILMGRISSFLAANLIGQMLEFNCQFTFIGLAALIITASLIAALLPRKPPKY